MSITKTINRLSFVLLFVFIYLYFLRIFDLSLYSHLHQPIFINSQEFFNEFAYYPGGLPEWVAQFIFQFFHINAIGALIVTLILAVIFGLFYLIIKKTGIEKNTFFPAFIPLLFLVVIQNSYSYPYLVTLKFLFALLLFFLYRAEIKYIKIVLLILSGPIYYLLGGFGFAFYSLLCIVHELFYTKGKSGYLFISLLAGLYLIIPYLAARFLFLITLQEAYLYLIPSELYYKPIEFSIKITLILAFLAFPAIMVLIRAYMKWGKEKIRRIKLPEKLAAQTWLQPLAIMIIGIFVLKMTFSTYDKNRIKIDYYAEQGRWQEVLHLYSPVYAENREVQFTINRALAQTGQLLEHLFDYPQLFGTDGLFVNKHMAGQITLPASDLYFDLGHISASLTMAYEGQTKDKYNPRILKRLVITNIINNRFVAARKFLLILKNSYFHRKWAQKYMALIENQSLLKTDPLIQTKSSEKPTSDFFISNKSPNFDLVQLVLQHPSNKVAYEYLIAYYLLECKMGNLKNHLEKLENYHYTKIPRYIQEAMIMLRIFYPKDFKFDASLLDRETMMRFQEFTKISKKFIGSRNEEIAKNVLRKDFSDTFWYYLRFENPIKTNRKLSVRKKSEGIL